MRQLIQISRRQFGALTGAKLVFLASVNTASAKSVKHHVAIKRFKFDPPQLTIKPGDTVVWTNKDPAPHTATALDEDWDTAELSKDQSSSEVFETLGQHPYFCRFHPHMKGEITVAG